MIFYGLSIQIYTCIYKWNLCNGKLTRKRNEKCLTQMFHTTQKNTDNKLIFRLLSVFVLWRIPDSNRSPLACQASTLAKWANSPIFQFNSRHPDFHLDALAIPIAIGRANSPIFQFNGRFPDFHLDALAIPIAIGRANSPVFQFQWSPPRFSSGRSNHPDSYRES